MILQKALFLFPLILVLPGLSCGQAKTGVSSLCDLCEIPRSGCLVLWFHDKNGRCPKIVWRTITQKGKHKRSHSRAGINGINAGSGTKVFKSRGEKSYIEFDFTFYSPDPSEATYVTGNVATDGVCKVDIMGGHGLGTSYAWGKSEAVYGTQKIVAEGKTALAVTTAGTPKSVGGGVTVFGTGGSFQTSWVSDLPQARESCFSDFDFGGEEKTDKAMVGLGTAGTVSLTLIGSASGFSRFDANSACLLRVCLKEKEKPVGEK